MAGRAQMPKGHKAGCACPFCQRSRGVNPKHRRPSARRTKRRKNLAGEELIIFGNPAKGHKAGCACPICKRARGENPGELPYTLTDSASLARRKKRQLKREGWTDAHIEKMPQGTYVVTASKRRGANPKPALGVSYVIEIDGHPTGEIYKTKARAERQAKYHRHDSPGRKVAIVEMGRKERQRNNRTVAPGFEHLREQCRQHFPCRKPKRGNPDEEGKAVRLFQTFHGKDPSAILEKQRSAAMRSDYTALGDLEYITVHAPDGKTEKINFEGDGVKLASAPGGAQLYLIGGNQNLNGCLERFTADTTKDVYDLGEAIEVQYLARKAAGNFEPVSWYHKFGEEGGTRPRLGYDRIRKEVFFAGGEYRIEAPGIIN